ncbi:MULTISPECIES: MFS transporter [Psychrobacillus]|uniref:MFS transporter n=1 Tax=Psychrobacillus faecigallinarum TaxID=2762235 RepID=A0ABR8R8C7_9BACI|nr:MFS transporter [Psychrobacillus faecigallinarum]MBD7943777.1 MFS transporter [Psychrobacillus faecigallinarum]
MCIISISSIPLVMTLGNSMLIPVLPILEKKVDISSFQSSMIITSYSIAAIILIPVAGYLSDRLGRKKIILPCLLLALLGGLIAGFASWKMENPYTTIIIGRILQGMGAAGAMPIVLPLVGDLFKDDSEKTSSTLGIIETSNTLGKVLSPIIGSAIAAILWFFPFFSISIFSAIAFVLIFFFVKVPKGDNEEPDKIKEFLSKVKETFKAEGKWLTSVFLNGIFAMFVLFGVLFYLSEILEKIHDIKGVKKGFVLAIPLLFLCISSFLTGRKIEGKLKMIKRIMIISLIISSASVVFIGFVKEQLILLLIVTSILGIAIGAILPVLDTIITENIKKEERGTISSFYSSARFIGVAAGPPILSLVMKNYLNPFYIGCGILGILLMFLVFKLVKIDEIEKTENEIA